jgi:hypothetical protein
MSTLSYDVEELGTPDSLLYGLPILAVLPVVTTV